MSENIDVELDKHRTIVIKSLLYIIIMNLCFRLMYPLLFMMTKINVDFGYMIIDTFDNIHDIHNGKYLKYKKLKLLYENGK